MADRYREKWSREETIPDKFYPAKKFIEYHNDVVFLG